MDKQNTATINEFAIPELTAKPATEPGLHAPVIKSDPLLDTIILSGTALLEKRHNEGYWVFKLEADTTIPAEYILLQHFMGTVNKSLESRLVDYILEHQLLDGSWSLYEAGPGNISATVKSYLVLKLTGHAPSEEYMQRARNWVLTHGGAENANVFTRITLATFGQLPWKTVPAMPAEIIWLPKWSLFSLTKVSYWSRCVIVPLLLVLAYRPVHKLKPEQDIPELFITPPDRLSHIDKLSLQHTVIKNLFFLLDNAVKVLQNLVPAWLRRKSIAKCELWMREHMRGEGGIGAIFPAMANAVMALKLSECDNQDPDLLRGIMAIEDLVIDDGQQTFVQPCVSPVWDTCLSISALSEAGLSPDHHAVKDATDWLFDKQVFVRGDWAKQAPGLDSGGWAFQFENDFYPDVDDTSMVVMALLRADAHRESAHRKRIAQAVNWVIGMQNSDGGWAAFDIDNHHEYLNNIPFADHGALIDPSTADLTGRCIEMLAMLGYDRNFPPIARGLEFLKQNQEESGAWFGRWGVNYIYGTWAVLVGLGALGEDPNQPWIRKAITWLKNTQNSDGGWGEECNSYDDSALAGKGDSTASQTAWALLGLITIGELESESVEKGVNYLLENYEGQGGWKESLYTGTGFPRVFYLRYHGYSHYFPLWALGTYRQNKMGQLTRQQAVRNYCKDEGAIFPGLPAQNS